MDVNSSARRVTECRVCGKSDWQDVVSLGSLPLANGFVAPGDAHRDEPVFPLGVMSCRSCRLMSLTHVVNPELLYRTYAYVTSNSETITQHMRTVAEICTSSFHIPEGSLVVEMGSNTGTQLQEFQHLGMRPLGVDPARNLAARAIDNGIPTITEFFDAATAQSIVREHGRARLLLGRHVFAHIDDISGVLAGARALLEPDGVLAIEVPYALDMLAACEFDTIYHEHLSYFAVGPLATLFERHGMRLLDVRRMDVHGGSVLAFAGRADGSWSVRPTVAELLALEKRAGLHKDATYEEFAASVQRISTGLSQLVRRLVADGKNVAGYGASAKGSVILNVCQLTARELLFCSDTTDLKQGKLIPGTRIPVCTPDYAAAHPPDYYLLLAWNYADEILRKERAFLEAGGAFIKPIPTPAIVTASDITSLHG